MTRGHLSDSVTAPLNRDHGDNVGGDVDGFRRDIAAAEASLGEVLTAIPKVYFVLDFSVGLGTDPCSAQEYHLGCAFSPQLREAWLEEPMPFYRRRLAALSVVLGHTATMLILDVRHDVLYPSDVM